MIRIKEIVESFRTLVGWEGVDELETSESGLYFQEAHPLLTLRVMEAVMPKEYVDRIPKWDSAKEYPRGAKVRANEKVYRSLIDNNGHAVLTEYWEEYNVFYDFLSSLTTTGIKKVVTKFIQDKIIGLESKSIVDRRTLFDGAGNKNARIVSDNRLVGFELTPLRSNSITTTINKVGCQFVGNVGSFTLYLFHSSKAEPIATKQIDYTSTNGSFQWFDLTDWVLPYMSEETNAGGSWYVVYDQAELAYNMDAINFGRDWSKEPCGTCNKGDAQLYRLMNRYLTLAPFYVAVKDWDGTLWDIEDNVYTYGKNYGLNFLLSMDCDLTETLIRDKKMFAHAIQLQVASDALRLAALNPDVAVHRAQFNIDRDNILFETDGNGQGIKGLKGELDKAMKALEIDTKGLEPVCLGCHNGGIKYRSI